MKVARISLIVSQYQAGAITDSNAYIEVLMAAGEGDAEAIFASLPPRLRDEVTRNIANANPAEAMLLESYCGTALPEQNATDLRSREQIMRRGIAALQGLTARRSIGG